MPIRKVISRSIQDATIDLQTDVKATTRNTLRPSLSLNFTNSGVVDSRIKIQRNSKATVVNSSGYVEVVDANDGRINHNPLTKVSEGLLVEEARYNYALTDVFTQWSMNGSVKVDAGVPVVSPAGKFDTYALYESVTSAHQRFSAVSTTTISSGSKVWVTVYAKKGSRKYLTLDMAPTAYYDLDLGTATVQAAGGTATMQNVGNGWWKCMYSWTTVSTTSQTLYIGTSSTGSDGGLYAGSAASPAIYLWGVQMEVGAYPTSMIPFASDKAFRGRDSNATYIDGAGRIRTAAANVLRYSNRFDGTVFKPTGPLLEQSSTNLINQSTLVAWGLSSAGITAPDTTTTTVVARTSGSTLVGRDAASSYQDAVQTFSMYAKAADTTDAKIRLNVYCGVSGSDYGTGWNLGTEAVYASYGSGLISSKIEATGFNGWYRISITFRSPANTTTINCQAHLDGTSTVYLWGAQLELMPFATSYIPTSGSAASRSNDQCGTRAIATYRAEDRMTIQGADFSKFFNQAEGTFVVDFKMNYLDSGYNNPVVYANDGTSNNYLAVFGATTSYGWAQTSKGTSAGLAGISTSTDTDYSLAFAYKNNDFAASVNGSAVSTDTNGIVPQVNQLAIGWRRESSNKTLNGTIKKIVYYPLRMSNSDLVEFTN